MTILRFFILPLLFICGCGGPSEQENTTDDDKPAETSGPLSVIVLDDKPLGETVKRQWNAHSEAEVEIQHLSSAEFVAAESKPAADVIIYPAGLLGELVEGEWIRPVPDHVLAHPNIDSRDILPLDRGPNVTWGKTVYAFSFGSPSFVLFYRSDLFESMRINVPTTWDEYREIAEKLNDRTRLGESAPPADQPWSGTAEPLAPGWSSQLLLARAASYVRRRSRYSTLFNYSTMQPLIDREPYVQSLVELQTASQFGPQDTKVLTPHHARQAIQSGECAMAISWPTRPSDEERSDDSKSFPISFAPLPGSRSVYNFADDRWEKRDDEDMHVPLMAVAGRLGSVMTSARNSRGALNLLARLTDKELGASVAAQSESTTMFRSSQFSRTEAWIDPSLGIDAARQYESVVNQTHKSQIWLYSIRIPGRLEYLRSLDDAAQQVVCNDQDPAQQLKTVAEKWSEVTKSKKHGVEAQRQAYRKGLGLK